MRDLSFFNMSDHLRLRAGSGSLGGLHRSEDTKVGV